MRIGCVRWAQTCRYVLIIQSISLVLLLVCFRLLLIYTGRSRNHPRKLPAEDEMMAVKKL